MNKYDYALKPAWIVLHVSIIAHGAYLVLAVGSVFFQNIVRLFLFNGMYGGTVSSYFYFPVINVVFLCIAFVFHFILFVAVRMLIAGKTNYFIPIGVFIGLYVLLGCDLFPRIASFLENYLFQFSFNNSSVEPGLFISARSAVTLSMSFAGIVYTVSVILLVCSYALIFYNNWLKRHTSGQN